MKSKRIAKDRIGSGRPDRSIDPVREFWIEQGRSDPAVEVTPGVDLEMIQGKIDRFRSLYLFNSYWGGAKRIFDVVLSTLILVFVMSWMYPLIALLIKLDSRGPVLFKQKRSGVRYEPFEIYKFRTMRLNELSNTVPTQVNDPRITRIGKYLRKLSLDEIPQILNVLKGDMSLVGPRPHMLTETQNFDKIADEFYKRHMVKPGITGLAQIRNCRGQINNYDQLIKRLKYDLYYIKRASVYHDLNIIIATIVQVFRDYDEVQ